MELTELKATLDKKFNISLGFMALMFIAMCLMGWFMMNATASFSKAVGHLDSTIESYQKDVASLKAKLDADEQLISALSKNQAALEARKQQRDTKANQDVQKVTQPDRPVQDVAHDADTYLGELPTFEPDTKLGFSVQSVQKFVASKITLDRCEADLDDTKKQYADEQKKTEKLTEDLGLAMAANKKAQDALDEAKKVVKKTKWQRVKDGAGKASGWIAAVAIAVLK